MGGDFAGRFGRVAWLRRRLISEADVLVDTAGAAGGICRTRSESAYALEPASLSRISSAKNPRPRTPALPPCMDQRSCYDRASRIQPIAAEAPWRPRRAP